MSEQVAQSNRTMQRQPKLKVVSGPRNPAPQKLVKEAQCLLILLVFFELHGTQTKSEKDIHIKALKYYEQNVANFVNDDVDARSDEGMEFLQSKDRCANLTSAQLLKGKTIGPNLTGKQLWTKAKEIRRFVVNQITPVYNSFLKYPGAIFPSGWEIEDMLEATRRKMYADSRGTQLNLTDEPDEEEEVGRKEIENASPESCSSLENSVTEGTLPSTFPSELRTLVIPSNWQPSYWSVFLWFGNPCEFVYSGRTSHPQLSLGTGNGPDAEDDNDVPNITVKKEGAGSLSRTSQKRKANAEAAAENESINSGSTTASWHTSKATSADRELDLAERVQKQDESDRVLTLLKEKLADAEDSPERSLARTQIKAYRNQMIESLMT